MLLVALCYTLFPLGEATISFFDVKSLADKEEEVYSKFKLTHGTTSNNVPYLTEYIKDYESCTGAAQEKYNFVFDHPLLTYRMVYRWQHYIPSVLKETHDDSLAKELEFVTNLITKASSAVLDLQFFYNIPAKELIDGNFLSVKTEIGLNLHQALQLAEEGLAMEYYVQVWDWLNVIQTRAKAINDTVILKEAQKLVNRLSSKHDKVYIGERQKGFHKYVFVDAISNVTQEERDHPVPLFHYQMEEFLEIGEGSGLPAERNYKHIAMCSNSTLIENNPPPRSNLRCWNDPQGHPFFMLAPRKVEKLWDSPDVYQFYDVFSPAWINALKSMAASELEKYPNLDGAMHFTSIPEDKFPPIGKSCLNDKLEALLGINLGGNYRVSVYHQGAQGQVHHDSYQVPNYINEVNLLTKRLASILIYMGDTKLGGETVFPDIPLKVNPVKGSILYWRNYVTEDLISWKVWHAPCPTVLGNRWFIAYFVPMENNIPVNDAYIPSVDNMSNI